MTKPRYSGCVAYISSFFLFFLSGVKYLICLFTLLQPFFRFCVVHDDLHTLQGCLAFLLDAIIAISFLQIVKIALPGSVVVEVVGLTLAMLDPVPGLH